MNNQKVGNVGNENDMIEQFKKFMSLQKQQEQPKEEVKKQTKKPVITVQKNAQLQAIPPPPPPPTDDTDDEIEYKPQQVKPKRQISEKQMENLIQGRIKRDELRKQRAEEKAKQDEEYKRVVEEKIVKKAIQIKKKKLKQEKLIEPDPESDNETLIKNQPKKPAPVTPHKPVVQQPAQPQRKFYFV